MMSRTAALLRTLAILVLVPVAAWCIYLRFAHPRWTETQILLSLFHGGELPPMPPEP